MKKLLIYSILCAMGAPVLSQASILDSKATEGIEFVELADPYGPARNAYEFARDKLAEYYTTVHNNTTDYALVGFRGLVSGAPGRLVLIDPGASQNVVHSGDTLVVKLVKFTHPPFEQPIVMRGYSKITLGTDKSGKITAIPSK